MSSQSDRYGLNLYLSEPLSIKGSNTRALVGFTVTDMAAAEAAIGRMKQHPDMRTADTLAAAYILPDSRKTSFSDDDNEPRFGTVALSKLKELETWGAVVVVARWYGGEQCGKTRFEHVKQTIESAFAGAGHVKGQALRDAVFRKGGEGRLLEEKNCAKVLRGEEMRNKRLERLSGGGGLSQESAISGGGGFSQESAIELLDDSDGESDIDGDNAKGEKRELHEPKREREHEVIELLDTPDSDDSSEADTPPTSKKAKLEEAKNS